MHWLCPLCVVLPCLLLSCTRGTLSPGPFQVDVEEGTRLTAAGDRIAYSLFIPRGTPGLPPPPWPAVVLNHGFARNHSYQRNNALYMAERGLVVLTPDMVSLLAGEPAQLRNVANTLDHVLWLRQRAADPNDVLAGLVDPDRIGLAGHSAGGAVSFEAAAQSQATVPPVAAVVLLDAVPWARTITQAGRLQQLPLCSLRSEPSNCNADAAVLDLLRGLAFPVQDVRIVNGTHCDPENPTDGLCTLACGDADTDRQATYQRLMYLFFQDALSVPSVETESQTYGQAIQQYQAQGSIQVMP